MQSGRRYTFFQTLKWQFIHLLTFLIYSSVIVLISYTFKYDWMIIPWQPISLIGIAVAFYLGFKNNSSYERMWEARKIWGGIVNTSRSFTVMVRDFVAYDANYKNKQDEDLKSIKRAIIHRHVAWLKALTYQLRKVKSWEHNSAHENAFREMMEVDYKEENFENLKVYLSEKDYEYIMNKGNRASHLLSIQSKHLMQLRKEDKLEHFRHLEIQSQITELYTLQGKTERIKNFPFPRQYATVNHFFAVIFILLLPFGMLNVFTGENTPEYHLWFTIPFSVIVSWVFWTMEMVGDYSENPFEGLYNDVPISSMALGIEIDIRQMLDETDLPDPWKEPCETGYNLIL